MPGTHKSDDPSAHKCMQAFALGFFSCLANDRPELAAHSIGPIDHALSSLADVIGERSCQSIRGQFEGIRAAEENGLAALEERQVGFSGDFNWMLLGDTQHAISETDLDCWFNTGVLLTTYLTGLHVVMMDLDAPQLPSIRTLVSGTFPLPNQIGENRSSLLARIAGFTHHEPIKGDWLEVLPQDLRSHFEQQYSFEGYDWPRYVYSFVAAEIDQLLSSGVPEPLPLSDNLFRKKGDDWNIRYAGGDLFAMKDSVGLFYISILLKCPNESVPVEQLRHMHDVRKSDPESSTLRAAQQMSEPGIEGDNSHVTDAGEVLDDDARLSYKEKLDEISEELAKAAKDHDEAAKDRLYREKTFILAELEKDLGFGGKPKLVSPDAKRNRDAVRNRIKDSIKRIKEIDESLGLHLENSLNLKDPYCYKPERPISWT